MPGTRRRNVSFDPHVYERTAPPIIESEFLQSNNRGAVQLRPRGRTSPCSRCKRKGRAGNPLPLPGLSTVLPWPYFLCRAASVWFPRRRNSINPTPKSVNAANATVGVDTPVLASRRIVFTMAGVAGGMYELVNSGWVPVVVTMPGVVDGPSPTAPPWSCRSVWRAWRWNPSSYLTKPMPITSASFSELIVMLWPIWRRSFDPCTRLSDPLP